MELLLNLVWAAIASAALGGWLCRCRRAGFALSRTVSGIVVLSCALAFLFPVISLSDDLYASFAVSEDATAYARKAKVSQGSAQGLAHASTAPFLPSAFYLSHGSMVFGQVDSDDTSAFLPSLLLSDNGRSPPFNIPL